MSVTIIKNGRRVVVNGNYVKNVKIDKMTMVLIDGKPIKEFGQTDEKVINISIQGDIERLEVDCCENIKVTGNARRIKSNQGDIEIHGNVEGDVHSNMGSITCGNVNGDCHANMGSIIRR